jgi:hypothetical protein
MVEKHFITETTNHIARQCRLQRSGRFTLATRAAAPIPLL